MAQIASDVDFEPTKYIFMPNEWNFLVATTIPLWKSQGILYKAENAPDCFHKIPKHIERIIFNQLLKRFFSLERYITVSTRQTHELHPIIFILNLIWAFFDRL